MSCLVSPSLSLSLSIGWASPHTLKYNMQFFPFFHGHSSFLFHAILFFFSIRLATAVMAAELRRVFNCRSATLVHSTWNQIIYFLILRLRQSDSNYRKMDYFTAGQISQHMKLIIFSAWHSRRWSLLCHAQRMDSDAGKLTHSIHWHCPPKFFQWNFRSRYSLWYQPLQLVFVCATRLRENFQLAAIGGLSVWSSWQSHTFQWKQISKGNTEHDLQMIHSLDARRVNGIKCQPSFWGAVVFAHFCYASEYF